MSRDKGELKPRDKVVTKMTREGAVKENLTENSMERIVPQLDMECDYELYIQDILCHANYI